MSSLASLTIDSAQGSVRCGSVRSCEAAQDEASQAISPLLLLIGEGVLHAKGLQTWGQCKAR